LEKEHHRNQTSIFGFHVHFLETETKGSGAMLCRLHLEPTSHPRIASNDACASRAKKGTTSTVMAAGWKSGYSGISKHPYPSSSAKNDQTTTIEMFLWDSMEST